MAIPRWQTAGRAYIFPRCAVGSSLGVARFGLTETSVPWRVAGAFAIHYRMEQVAEGVAGPAIGSPIGPVDGYEPAWEDARRVARRPGLGRRLATWYETTASPRLVLTAVVLALFLPTLVVPFFIDDYRNQRLLEEFHAGNRDMPGLYAFFPSAAANAAERAAGRAPWWISDDVRFEYHRPLAEASLYLDYLIWRDSAAGQRLTNVLLYLGSVLLALALFRAMSGDEARARWAALAFAVAACHAIPVLFIAARCDLLALIATLGCMLLGLRFVRAGGWGVAAASAGCYILGLLSKEITWPGFAAFAILAWGVGGRGVGLDDIGRVNRRVIVHSVVLGAVGLAWLILHRLSGDGINSTHVLDPLARPLEYLAEAPQRVLVYAISWLIPVNPALFYYHSSGRVWLLGFVGVGAVALIAAGLRIARASADRRADLAAALWPLPYLAILACALPDDRLMMLPSIGLAYLAAGLIRAAQGELGGRLARALPVLVFLVLPACVAPAATAVIYGLETRAAEDQRAMAAEVRASGVQQPCVFLVNAVQAIHAIWAQDRARLAVGPSSPTFDYLCDLPYVDAEVVDAHTLALVARDDAFLSTLLGSFGMPRGTVLRVGERFESTDYSVTVRTVREGRPTRIELRFHERLDSPRYFFFNGTNDAPPARWHPQVGQRRAFNAFMNR